MNVFGPRVVSSSVMGSDFLQCHSDANPVSRSWPTFFRVAIFSSGSRTFLAIHVLAIDTRDMAAAKMTTTQLIRALAEANGLTNVQARGVMDTLASLAVQEVKKNGLFVIPGIGRLVRVDRKARMGRNPATGESIKIAAKKVVKFRVAKSAKDAIVPAKVKKA